MSFDLAAIYNKYRNSLIKENVQRFKLGEVVVVLRGSSHRGKVGEVVGVSGPTKGVKFYDGTEGKVFATLLYPLADTPFMGRDKLTDEELATIIAPKDIGERRAEKRDFNKEKIYNGLLSLGWQVFEPGVHNDATVLLNRLRSNSPEMFAHALPTMIWKVNKSISPLIVNLTNTESLMDSLDGDISSLTYFFVFDSPLKDGIDFLGLRPTQLNLNKFFAKKVSYDLIPPNLKDNGAALEFVYDKTTYKKDKRPLSVDFRAYKEFSNTLYPGKVNIISVNRSSIVIVLNDQGLLHNDTKPALYEDKRFYIWAKDGLINRDDGPSVIHEIPGAQAWSHKYIKDNEWVDKGLAGNDIMRAGDNLLIRFRNPDGSIKDIKKDDITANILEANLLVSDGELVRGMTYNYVNTDQNTAVQNIILSISERDVMKAIARHKSYGGDKELEKDLENLHDL